MSERRLETRLIHAGEPHIEGAVSMPIFQSSTFLSRTEDTNYDTIRYLRLNNTPNHEQLHTKLASINGAEAALVTASGMSAITTTLMTFLRPGDHVLLQSGVYGGTHSFIRETFRRLGIDISLVDPTSTANWSDAVSAKTKLLFMETISNPSIVVGNLVDGAAFAQAHNLVSVVDNTFASPINCRPIELGFDLSIESASKYLNGHSDLVAGAIVGTADHIDQIRHELNHWGGTLDPHACYLLQRGMKTLAMRVRHQNGAATALARSLETDDRVARVNYPGLPNHAQHAYAAEHLHGNGGMLSFELADPSTVGRFLSNLTLGIVAPSLGGPETLVTQPAATSHVGLTPEERAQVGVSDGLIRVSVGFEHAADITADFRQALNRL